MVKFRLRLNFNSKRKAMKPSRDLGSFYQVVPKALFFCS